MPKTFICDKCGKEDDMSESGTAEEEFARLFPGEHIADAAVVCDECWEVIKPPGPVFKSA